MHFLPFLYILEFIMFSSTFESISFFIHMKILSILGLNTQAHVLKLSLFNDLFFLLMS